MTEKQREKMNELAKQDRKLLVPQDGFMSEREFIRGYTSAHNDATAIIETLEKAIRRAQKYERQQVMEDWGNPGFDGTEGTIRIQTSYDEALAELNKWRNE